MRRSLLGPVVLAGSVIFTTFAFPVTSASALTVPTTPAVSNIPSAPTYGGNFIATVATNSDGVTSVTSSTPSVCTVGSSGLTVSFAGVGSCTLTAHVAASATYSALDGNTQTFGVGQAIPTTPTITNLPTGAIDNGMFVATVSTNGDGTTSVTSNSTSVCTVASDSKTVDFIGAGTCSVTAHVVAGTLYVAADGMPQTFSVGQATPSPPTVSNIPMSPVFGGNFKATVDSSSDSHTTSVTSSTPSVCTVGGDGLTVSFAAAGSCTVTAHVAASSNYVAADGTPQTFPIGKASPSAPPTLDNPPSVDTYGRSFQATVTNHTAGDTGALSVTSTTPSVCATNGLVVKYVGVGICSLTPNIAADANYVAADGTPKSITVAQASPSTPNVTNVPTTAVEFAGFTADIGTNGDGVTSVVSNTPGVCQVQSDGQTVLFLTMGACTLTASVGVGTNFFGATGTPQTFQVGPAPRGYWLVGSDGGIFSFGAAAFSGSMGGTVLQRPVVGITPTLTRGGYWLVASDGGIFSFGDAGFYGSIPGVGIHPAGSGLPHSLAAPIVGMVPSINRRGYFMVASDGGVFAFGGAKFEGSCPGIGGCAGTAVAVMPDHTGDGYWLITSKGGVYSFGDAPFYGAPIAQSVPVVNAAATPDGMGYWLLYANGVVANFGDAVNFGSPVGYVNAYNAANTIFPTADGQGYWIASTRGDVFSYGNAPWLGSMSSKALNGQIIAGFGF